MRGYKSSNFVLNVTYVCPPVLPLHSPDLDELAALARRDEEPVAAEVENVDGLVVVLARSAVSSRAC